MKKKICFVVYSIYNLGGIERVVVTLANNLVEYYDVTILCLADIANKKKVNFGIDNRVTIYEISKPNSILALIINRSIKIFNHIVLKLIKNNQSEFKQKIANNYSLFLKKKLRKYFNERKFNYILSEGLNINFLLADLGNIEGSNVIGCWHSNFDRYIEIYPRKLIEKSLKKLNDTIVLCNDDTIKIKEHFGVNVKYIYNPIAKSKECSNLVNNKFLAVGRYSKIKNFDALIDAFYLFHKENIDWTLDILGDGPERDRLQKKIEQYNLQDCIKLCGYKDNVYEYYINSSCLLMTSINEGFPMTIVEAMSFGLPIIVFEIPVFHEIFPKRYRYIVNQGDISTFSLKMLDISRDFELRKELGNVLKKEVEKFSMDEIINEWKHLLK